MASRLLSLPEEIWVNPLPEEIWVNVFSFLNAAELTKAASVCKTWNRISRDESLWRTLLCAKYGLELLRMNSKDISWRDEYQRMEDRVPSVEVQVLTLHTDGVMHVCFSNDGNYFVSCSRDGKFAVWKCGDGDPFISLVFVVDMTRKGWANVRHAEFNGRDDHLIVCGCKRFLCYDGEVAVFQFTEERRCTLVHTLSLPRNYCNCPWYDDRTHLTGLAYNDSKLEYSVSLNKVKVESAPSEFSSESHNVFPSESAPECLGEFFTGELKPNLSLVTSLPQDDANQKYLVFSAGLDWRCPQFLCFKKLEFFKDEEKQQQLNHYIDLKGMIAGMCLSPDKNFLYLTTYPLEGDGQIHLDFARPAYDITNEVRVQILDLKTLSLAPFSTVESVADERGWQINYDVSPSVSPDYVTTGSFNSFVYIFDRTYGKCISRIIGHSCIVNAAAFNPRDQGMLVTGSEDKTIRVWKSKEAMRNKTCPKE